MKVPEGYADQFRKFYGELAPTLLYIMVMLVHDDCARDSYEATLQAIKDDLDILNGTNEFGDDISVLDEMLLDEMQLTIGDNTLKKKREGLLELLYFFGVEIVEEFQRVFKNVPMTRYCFLEIHSSLSYTIALKKD